MKPAACSGCPLEDKGKGFAPGVGPMTSPILLLGEALGTVEARKSEPFVGPAGAMLTRLLTRAGLSRDSVRISNCCKCFTGDTLVSAQGIQRAFRRWYSGPLTTVRTRDGILSGTPNHPVLTAKGWVPLGKVVKGDYLVCGTFGERMTSGDPDVQDVPSQFSDVFQSLSDLGIRRRVVGSNVDFHGDGSEGEIDVVELDGSLCIPPMVMCGEEEIGQSSLEASYSPAGHFPVACEPKATAPDTLSWNLAPPCSCVGRSNECPSSLGTESLPAHPMCIAVAADRYTISDERIPQCRPAAVDLARQRLQPLPRQVSLSKVLHVEHGMFSGHVYNLQTKSEQYIANGFIVHNCQPPNDWLSGAPWEVDALAHCRKSYLDEELSQWHKAGGQVIVPLGDTALRQILQLHRMKGVRVQDFHGTVSRDPSDRFWVVPTYHPSFLMRGAFNFTSVVAYDLRVAKRVTIEGFERGEFSLVCDPPVAWFRAWADQYLAALRQDPRSYWLAVDTETTEKAQGADEGELAEGIQYSFHDDTQIVRINFACHPDEGITVPFQGPYLEIIQDLLASEGIKLVWHADYDLPRLRLAGMKLEGDWWDLMWAWHVLQSDLPRGLGFVSPFYSDFGPWKHWAKLPGEEIPYAAADGIQTIRCGHGIVQELCSAGMWHLFEKQIHQVDKYVLKPAEAIGILTDKDELLRLGEKMTKACGEIFNEIQALVPDEVKPLSPKQGLKKKPEDPAGKYLEKQIKKLVQVCKSCGKEDVAKSHACAPKVKGVLELQERVVTRYFIREPFLPSSHVQVLDYITYRRHKAGKAKKTKKPTTDKKTLDRLVKSTKDPVYKLILDHRAVAKVLGTYVNGSLERLDKDNRLHPTFTWKPSTLRSSCVNPNIQNIVTDRGGKESIAAGYRRAIVASPGCVLVEADYSGIEAVLSGWFMGDPQYMRLAKLGMHAYVASHELGRPADLHWSDDDLRAYFKEIKGSKDPHVQEVYHRSKRCVHGEAYGLTVQGMVDTFPEVFPTLKAAQKVSDLYHALAPKLPRWHNDLRAFAKRHGYWGGPGLHPFGLKHWFWAIFSYQRLTQVEYARLALRCKKEKVEIPVEWIQGDPYRVRLGPDANRVVAFPPQSTARYILTSACLRLLKPGGENYIGDLYYGRTPARAIIHDSLLSEVPERKLDLYLERVHTEMTKAVPELPLSKEAQELLGGTHLSIGVDFKIGRNWLETESIKDWKGQNTDDRLIAPQMDADEEDLSDLGVSVV